MATSSWARQFRDFLADQVTLEPWTGQDAFGEPIFGPAVTYRARVEQGSEVVGRGVTGEEIVSTAQVYLAEPILIQERDRLTLPSDFTARQPPIIRVIRHRDEIGRSHVVVYT